MKKFSLFIVTLALLIFFAGADYLVNTPSTINREVLAQIISKETMERVKEGGDDQETDPKVIQGMLTKSPQEYPYTLQSRSRAHQLFETFDLRLINNIRVYKNALSGDSSPMVIYEIHGPKNQGKLTYLNVKLKILAQVDLAGNINETGEFGESSLFYNDENAKAIGFLLVQVGDMLLGFQYNKEDGETFNTVKKIISTLNS